MAPLAATGHTDEGFATEDCTDNRTEYCDGSRADYDSCWKALDPAGVGDVGNTLQPATVAGAS